MFSLRSARGRAILAGLVLLVLLVGFATLAICGTRNVRQQHSAFEHTSSAATALEGAHAQFRREQAAVLSILLFSGDSSLLDDYHDAAAATEQHLSDARAGTLTHSGADELRALDDLTERIGQFNETVDLALPFLLAADPETRLQLATASKSEMWSEAEAIVADLQTLVQKEQQQLAATQAAADRAADTTLWLLVGSGTGAFLIAAGTVAVFIVSVVGPLAALRASARAITSGDLKARARISGPEEVASLAHDFNEMTDALAAKTQEFIDTTNLTGVTLLRLDKDARVAFLNDATCQFLGRPEEEILGAQITDYLHPDDVEPTTQALRRMIKSKEPMLGAVSRYVTPLGTRVAEWNAYPLFDEQGQYAGLQGTGRDITERKRAEEALRRQEYELAERAKELNCLYGISVLVDKPGISLQEILQGTADLIPAAWQYPQVTCARIIVDGQEFRTANFKETAWRQASNITVSDQRAGSVEVYYLDQRPESDEGPFLKEERTLINAVGERLGHISERKRAQEALRESEARYKALFAGAPEGMLVADSQTRQFRYANPAMCMMSGYTEEELLRLGVADIHPKESLDHVVADFEAQARGEKPLSAALPCLRKDGTVFYADIRSIAIVLDGRKCSVGIFSDVTERKRAEEALRESEEAFRLLFENAKDAIFHADPATGLITKCNRAAETLLEKDREEIIGQPQATIHPPQKAERYIQMFKRHMEQQGFVEDEAEVITKSGKTKPVLITASVASVRGTPIIQGSFRDISERKRLEAERERLHAELEERAITDGLTGLYNHAHFFQRLDEELERAKRYGRSFSILMMDVDKFKQFNDTRGHPAGDVALRLLADCIRAGLRRSDIAFRYGGDEFAAILLNADSSRAQAIAKRVKRCITRRLQEANDPAAAWLGLSTGVACFPDDATTADDLVKVADAALYDAKRVTHARSAIDRAQPAEPLASAKVAVGRKG